MRKIYPSILFILFLLISNKQAEAQVSLYNFLQTTGTYTPITGGTVLGTTSSDDQYFVDPAIPAGGSTSTGVGFPIGFNFTYDGVIYDRFGVNNNGWVALGQSTLTPSINLTTTSAYTPLSSTAALSPAFLRSRIAGMGRDLQGQAGSELRFETIGTAPNRKLVVQYTNYKRFGTAGTGDNFNFQIILNEAQSSVQVMYGNFVFNTTTTTSTIDHVGLGGLVSTDFNNRQTTSPHNWNNTSAGTANNQGCQNATSTIAVTPPVSGLTFTWALPACSGTPAGGTTQSPVPSPCYGSPFTLTVTGATSGVAGLTYQWESSPENTLWTPIQGAVNPMLSTTITVNTYYRRKITCAGSNEYSSSFLVSVLPLPALPVAEGFNTTSTTEFPGCWTQQYVVGSSNISFQTSSSNPATTPFEGTRYAYWNSFGISNNNETRLVSPAFTTTGASSLEVQFYWYNENSTQYNSGNYLLEGVQVQYSLDGVAWTNVGSFVPRYDNTLPSGTGQWKVKTVNLPTAANDQPLLYVGFKFHSSFGNNCSLDGVRIQTPCATITSQPTNQNVCLGNTVSLTVGATGDGLNYQWRKGGVNLSNGGNISGATSGTLQISNAAAGDAGNYDVVITGTCSTVATSNAVAVGVFTAPVIDTQPQDQTVCPGTNATFTVSTTGSGITYQWRKGGVNLTDGGSVSGATTNSLTITGAAAANTGTYDVVVTQNCSISSTAVSLNLYTPPSVSTQPTNKFVCLNGNVTFTVTAAGSGLNYQWRKGGVNLTNGGNISGATTSSLAISNATAADAATYDVVILGTCEPAVTSNEVTLSIENAIVFTTQPVNRTSCQTGSVTFTAAATGTITTTQWQVSTNGGTTWTDIAGANTTTLTLSNVQPSQNNYRYRLVLANAGCGAVNSSAAILTVNPLPTVNLSLNPGGQTQLRPGLATTVTVNSTPAGASYQWFLNGVAQPAITGASYAVDAYHLGTYTVRVTDVNGCVSTTSGVKFTALPTTQLFIYPNPTTGTFYVTYYMPSVSTPLSITVTDMAGRKMMQRHEVTSAPYTRFDFTNSKLTAGVYIIEVRNRSGDRLDQGQLVVMGQ